MRKPGNKRSLFLWCSIGLNALLAGSLAIGFVKGKEVTAFVVLTEIQHNLIELEGLIENQRAQNWPAPNLVTTELNDIRAGIQLGMTVGGKIGTLSNTEIEVLQTLYFRLAQYPEDELYKFSVLTAEDKDRFEELRTFLRESGLGLNMGVPKDLSHFISQVERLVELMEESNDENARRGGRR